MNTTHTQTGQNRCGGPIAGLGLPRHRLRPFRASRGLWIGRRQSPAAALKAIATSLAGLQATVRQARSPLEPRKPAVEAQTPVSIVEPALEVVVASSPDHLPVVLRLLNNLAARGAHVSPLPRSWTSAAKLLPQEPGFPSELDVDGLNDILAEAEAGGLLLRAEYRDSQRKSRTRWSLTPTGLDAIGRRAAPAADAQVAEGDLAQPAHVAPLEACVHALELALAEGGIAPTAAVIDACGYGPVPAAVVSRDSWLDAFVGKLAVRQVGEVAAVKQFARAARELLDLGQVRMVGGLVWEA